MSDPPAEGAPAQPPPPASAPPPAAAGWAPPGAGSHWYPPSQYPPPPYGAPQWYPPAGAPAGGGPRTEPFAIVSLVASLAGWIVCWFVGPIAAIVFGHIARARIKRSGDGGAGLAKAGLIIGYIEVALGIAGIVVLVIVIALASNHNAVGRANRLGTRIDVVADRTGTTPRDADVVRTAIREAQIGDGSVTVGSTAQLAVFATTDDLRVANWELEVDDGSFSNACLLIPASTAEPVTVHDGSC